MAPRLAKNGRLQNGQMVGPKITRSNSRVPSSQLCSSLKPARNLGVPAEAEGEAARGGGRGRHRREEAAPGSDSRTVWIVSRG